MGKLQGINLTPELRSVVDAALALPRPVSSDEIPRRRTDGKGEPSSPSPPSSPLPPSAPIETARVRVADPGPPGSPPAADEARATLEAAVRSPGAARGEDDASPAADGGGAAFLPLAGVPALKCVVARSRSPPDERARLLRRLEAALRRASLSFAPELPPKSSDPAYVKRLERLRLLDEERSYNKITGNLKTRASQKDDDVTARSMTYATSVGLNMIVAPLSFGTFMYFFAGSIFSRFFDNEDERDGAIDVRSVIAGVVSGVFMLFVEMILFVIRSHELDASVRRKGRREENRRNPFGYTEKSMRRVYDRDE